MLRVLYMITYNDRGQQITGFGAEPTWKLNTVEDCRDLARSYLSHAIAARDDGDRAAAEEYLWDARRMLRHSYRLAVVREYRAVPHYRAT